MRLPVTAEALSHQLSRRALTGAVLLTLGLPIGPPRPAIADDEALPACSYATLSTLPDVLAKVNNRASGNPKDAEAEFQGDALLADPKLMSTALEACAADDGAKKEALKYYAGLREELAYQVPPSPRAPAPPCDDESIATQRWHCQLSRPSYTDA